MEKYISLLIEQFKQATGIKNVDINSQSFMLEFSEWIKSRQNISNNYLDLRGILCAIENRSAENLAAIQD